MASVKNTEKTENSQTPNKSGVYAGSFIRCRNVSQSFDLSETITEKIEDITEKLEGFKKDVSQSFQEFTKEWSGRQNQAPPWQKQKHILRG